MVLSDRDILRALEEGRIRIEPAPDLTAQLGSVSIDFRLGTTFMMFEHSRHSYIDPRHPQSIGEAMRTIEVSGDEPFIMQPGDFALALDCRVARAAGRPSGTARGALEHCPAGDHGAFDGGSLRTRMDRHGNDGAEQPGQNGGRALSRDADLRLLLRDGEFAGYDALSR